MIAIRCSHKKVEHSKYNPLLKLCKVCNHFVFEVFNYLTKATVVLQSPSLYLRPENAHLQVYDCNDLDCRNVDIRSLFQEPSTNKSEGLREIKLTTHTLGFTLSTQYLAGVLYLEYFEYTNLRGDKSYPTWMIGRICLFLASKMREKDDHFFLLTEYINLNGHSIELLTMKELEIKICSYFDWNIRRITFFDYLEHYSSIGLMIANEKVLDQNGILWYYLGTHRALIHSQHYESVLRNIEKLAYYYADRLFEKTMFNRFSQSQLGLIALCLAKLNCGIQEIDIKKMKRLYRVSGDPDNLGHTLEKCREAFESTPRSERSTSPYHLQKSLNGSRNKRLTKRFSSVLNQNSRRESSANSSRPRTFFKSVVAIKLPSKSIYRSLSRQVATEKGSSRKLMSRLFTNNSDKLQVTKDRLRPLKSSLDNKTSNNSSVGNPLISLNLDYSSSLNDAKNEKKMIGFASNRNARTPLNNTLIGSIGTTERAILNSKKGSYLRAPLSKKIGGLQPSTRQPAQSYRPGIGTRGRVINGKYYKTVYA